MAAIRESCKAKIHGKSDERILGAGDFVDRVLKRADDSFERRYALKARGIDVDDIEEGIVRLLDMHPEDIRREGKHKRTVAARSLVCYWAARELGVSMSSLSRRFNISTAAVSKSVRRGAEIADNEGYELAKLIS